METPIEIMYNAAKVDIPAEAAHMMRVANKLQTALATLDVQSAEAGDPAALRSMLHVGGDMHAVLGQAVTTMDNCAVAVQLTADDYVQTDEQARADYEAMNDRLKNLPMSTHEPNPLTPPEAPGHEVEAPPFAGPPGSTVHVDAAEDPTLPSEDEAERGDGSEDQPDVPEIERDEWS